MDTPTAIAGTAPAPSEPGDRARSRRPARWRSALAGLLAAGVALAVGELVAGLSSKLTSPVISVGNQVVDAVPRQLKDFAIEQFGTNDKIALLAGIYVFAAVFGLVIGIVASRTFVLGAVGIALFGAVGTWAAGNEVAAPWWAGLPSIVGAALGIAVLAVVLATVRGADHPSFVAPVVAAAHTEAPAPTAGAGGLLARRAFLKVTAAVVVVGAAAASSGRWLQGRFSAAASRASVVLPEPGKPIVPVAEGVDLEIDGVSNYVTSNADFYRIDTNLTVPQIAADEWTLKIKGMVDEELTFTYEDILAMPMVEERITMTCVSNEIGGGLVGNAVWLGTPLEAILDQAGIQQGADQIVGRAFDGFTTGWPVENLRDGRNPLLVVGMNGEPLPLAHGFPARLVVPGLYGFVSATKWLTEIELTTFADFDQYWVKREWSDRGPIKTMSRIDTPRGLAKVKPGKVPIAGVAWAQPRGISQVQVKVDDGEWADARLAKEDSGVTWRQWVYEWDATPGRHTIDCRAVDGDGEAQTTERARPFPDGVSGIHSIVAICEEA